MDRLDGAALPPPGGGKDGDRRRQRRDRRRAAFLISPVAGVVQDVGAGGFSVETWEPLVVKRRYSVLLGENGGRGVRLACRVEWCRLVRAEKTTGGDVVSVYRLGLSYLGFDERRGIGG